MASLAGSMNAGRGWSRHRSARAGQALGWWLAGIAALGLILEAVRRYPDHAGAVAVAAAALLAGALAVVAEPAWGAGALIVLIYWNLSDVVTDTWGFSWVLKLALAGVVAAAALERLLAARRLRWCWPLALPLAGYGLALGLSAFGATDRAAALAFLEEFGRGVVMFYLVANLLTRPRRWRWGLMALLGGAGLLALPVAYQGLSGSTNTFWGLGARVYAEIAPGDWGWRLGGAIGDPNFLAMVLVAALPVALVAALERGAPRGRRLAGALVGALALTATVYTYSRAAALGLGLIAVAMLWKYRRRRSVWIAAGLALAATVAWAPAGLTARLATLEPGVLTARAQNIGDASLRIRRNAYLAGALMFLDHPLLGVGPGNYEANYLKYSAMVGLSSEDTVRDPHSLPIQIAAETGVVGLAAFAGLVWAAFALMERGRRRARRRGASHYADWIWSLELAVATYLLLSCFLHSAYFRHFWLLLALGATGASLALAPMAATASADARRALPAPQRFPRPAPAEPGAA